MNRNVRLRRWLVRGFVVAAALFALASWSLRRLPERGVVRQEVLQPPIQFVTDRAPFEFVYKGKRCEVRPVARYELWGLVVSHNDIHSFSDIYHDSTSVDTRDLCVVWGGNAERGAYREAKFWSGPWTCYFETPAGLPFDRTEISNNHLITDRPEIRAALGRTHVGDQVHLAGLLVDYRMEDWGGFWRRTSRVRNDSGCEVVFLEQFEVLERNAAGWHALRRVSKWLLVALPAAWLGAVVLEARRGRSSLGEL